MGVYVSAGTRLLDVLVLGDQQKISTKLASENMRFVIKTLGQKEKKLGSVSIPCEVVHTLKAGKRN
jgi:hypothetical protein